MPRALLPAVLSMLLAAPLAAAAPTFATAGAAVRDARDMIDVRGTVDALVRLGATEYLYDLPADAESWNRLPAFADAARDRGIAVDVYLAPYSQARKGGKSRQDGPFGTDYVAWADAIAKIARDHPSIRGIVIDDFGNNVGDDRFTPPMVAAMRDKLRAAGRPLSLRPVLYFDQPIDDLLESYAGFFDGGVVLCYPRSPREVDVALEYLRDVPRGASIATEISKRRHLQKGGGTTARATLSADAARRATRLTFYVDTRDLTPEHGRQRLIARVDGREVWHGELPRPRPGDRNVSIELPRLRDRATVELQVLVEEPAVDAEEEAVARISFDDVSVTDAHGDRIADVFWEGTASEGAALYVAPQRERGRPSGPRWTLPLTLLVAGSPRMHEKVFSEPATPAAIAGKTTEAIRWARAGKADGVISWALPLDGPVYDAVRRALR